MLFLFIILLHFKRDGTLDMRYKSSKQLFSSPNGENFFNHNGYHYKKDGTLDMRYKISQEYVRSGGSIYGPEYDDYY